jgi:hypothetical protein
LADAAPCFAESKQKVGVLVRAGFRVDWLIKDVQIVGEGKSFLGTIYGRFKFQDRLGFIPGTTQTQNSRKGLWGKEAGMLRCLLGYAP